MNKLPLAVVCLCASGSYALSQSTPVPLSAGSPATQSTPHPDSSSLPTPPARATQTTATPAAPVAPNTLLDGTPIKLKLDETISSEKQTVGEQVPFVVVEDVIVMGTTVIPKGTPALATVTSAEPKKRMGRGGKLDVNVDSTRLLDGEKVQLRAVQDNKGGGHVGAMTGAIVATSIVFFPAAPLFLLMHGKEVTIPKGTEITAFVQGDMKLDMAKMMPASVPVSTPGAADTAAAQMASVAVDSSVAGADIEVDGAFVGSTPSTVSVTPGQHTLTVKKKGYSSWTRTMNFSGSGAKVTADLETKP